MASNIEIMPNMPEGENEISAASDTVDSQLDSDIIEKTASGIVEPKADDVFAEEDDEDNTKQAPADAEASETGAAATDKQMEPNNVPDKILDEQGSEATEDAEDASPAKSASEAQNKESAPDDSTPVPTKRMIRRRSSPALEIDQKAATAIEVKVAESGESKLTVAEKRRAARAAAAESGGANVRTHSDAIRDSRMRERERQARQAEIVEIITAWSRLMDAQKRTRVVRGEVQAVEEMNKMVVAVMSLEGFRALIPFENFFLTDPIDYSTVTSNSDLRRRQMQMLTRAIGLETPVLIDEMVEGNDGVENAIILANRKSALKMLNERYFGKGASALQSGDKVMGRVTSVSSNSLRVLVGGTEVALPKFRATNRFIGYMSDMFQLNQELEVTIQSINRNSDGTLDIRIDARDSERESMIPNLDKIRAGGRYIGRVTHIHSKRSTGEIIYNLHMQMQDVVAVAIGAPVQYTSRPLTPGDSVVFQVDYVNYENGYAGGRIVRLC